MNFLKARVCLVLSFMMIAGHVPAYAQETLSLESQVQQLTLMVQDLKQVVEKQQAEIGELRRGQQIPSPSQSPMIQASPVSGVKILPEIGVIADTALRLDSPKNDEGGADRLSVREVELVLGSHVDPYSRLDATLAFTEEDGVELEEAYLTRFDLPLETTARIGRLKPRIGKVLSTHRDSLDTADEPLVIQRYFGEEGMSKTGADLKKILDLPSPLTHEITIGVLEGGNGEGGTAFGETHRRPTLYTHLKNYLDIDEMTSLEIGVSDAIGSRDADSEFEVNVLGFDGTWIHHFNANQNLKLQGEAFLISRTGSFSESEYDDGSGILGTVQDDIDGKVWGGYALADLRFHPQWATGLRLDQVELIDRPVDSPRNHDLGYTGYLTFYQSEFARWRVQYTHLDLTDGHQDNQVWLQGTFAIGEHKHKIQ